MSAPGRHLAVVLVAHYFPPHVGGIENVVAGEAAGLAKEGAEVTVVTTAVGRPAGTEHAGAGFRVVRLPTWNGVERRTGVPFPILAPWAVTSIVRHLRAADVVHCHDLLYMTTWFAVAVATVLGKPVVLTQHVELVRHPNRIVELVQQAIYATAGRAVARRAARVAVVNSRVAEFVQGLGMPAERVLLLPNGVDVDRFYPATDDRKRRLRRRLGLPASAVLALFVGRFVPKKGYDLLLAAAGGDYVLVLAGGAAPAGTEHRAGVVFAGSLPPDELADLYRACDVFVLPSESEGFPLTVQEAMASGLPVVTTDDPGYRVYELDRDGVVLVPRSVPEISAALRRLAGDPALRRRMGRYSLDVATGRFSWTAHVRVLNQLYDAAITGRR